MLLPRRGQPLGEVWEVERRVMLSDHCESFSLTESAERYLQLLPEAKIRGYLFEQQNYVPKERKES